MKFNLVNIPHSLNDAFELHLRTEMIHSTRLISVVALCLFLFSAFIDHVALPSILFEAWVIRSVCVTVLGLVFISTFSSLFIKYFSVIQLATCLVPAFGLICGIYLASPDDLGPPVYFGFLIMILMLMFSWTHANTGEIVLSALLLICGYCASVWMKYNADITIALSETSIAIFTMLGALSLGFIGRLVNENNVRQNFLYSHQLKELAKEQTYYATHDALTGLFNLYQTKLLFEKNIESAKKTGSVFTVMLLDLNDFKSINDDYCHQTGDEVLQVVSKRLRYCVREQDNVGRIGGDEFSISLLMNKNDSHLIAKVKDKISESVAQTIKAKGVDFNVGISIGYASYPNDGDDYKTLMNIADKRMYQEKYRKKKSFLNNRKKSSKSTQKVFHQYQQIQYATLQHMSEMGD